MCRVWCLANVQAWQQEGSMLRQVHILLVPLSHALQDEQCTVGLQRSCLNAGWQ